MSSPIEIPPFPHLVLSTWNREGGELKGIGVLPAWASLQATAPANLVGDPGDGSFCLIVNTPARAHDRPANEQVTAYEHLLTNAYEVLAAFLEAVFEEYGWMRKDFAEVASPEDAARLSPQLDSPANFCR